ncbi:hypothetical protein I1H34_12330 [Acaryochloris marina S15]|nr:hypothetical protein I1H34_12330 [Acaryochloris marina S15]
MGDCWMAITLANTSGVILSCRVGKHTDSLLNELVTSTEGKTDCKDWNSDDWGGYERGLCRKKCFQLQNSSDFYPRLCS